MHSPPDRFAFRSEGYAWGVVALLCFGGMISMLDRQVLILLVEPIKVSLAISDTQISLLQGFAVAIFYALLAVPLGRLADTGNRRNIIAIGALFFSMATIAGGFALTFGALFATRLCVGVGEATLTPAGSSLIGDYFPPEKVGRAMGMLTGSSFAGSGVSLVVIGGFIAWLAANPDVQFPWSAVRSIGNWCSSLPGCRGSALPPPCCCCANHRAAMAWRWQGLPATVRRSPKSSASCAAMRACWYRCSSACRSSLPGSSGSTSGRRPSSSAPSAGRRPRSARCSARWSACSAHRGSLPAAGWPTG